MNRPSLKPALLFTALTLAGQVFGAAEPAKPAEERAGARAAAKSAPRDSAGNLERAKEALENHSRTFNAERARMLERLKTATEEQRRTIMAQMKEQEEALLASARELARQARDDIKKQRAAPASPGGRRV